MWFTMDEGKAIELVNHFLIIQLDEHTICKINSNLSLEQISIFFLS